MVNHLVVIRNILHMHCRLYPEKRFRKFCQCISRYGNKREWLIPTRLSSDDYVNKFREVNIYFKWYAIDKVYKHRNQVL